MSETISPLAGKPAPASILVDVPALLAAELMAHADMDLDAMYRALTEEFGRPFSGRVQATANAAQRAALQ